MPYLCQFFSVISKKNFRYNLIKVTREVEQIRLQTDRNNNLDESPFHSVDPNHFYMTGFN